MTACSPEDSPVAVTGIPIPADRIKMISTTQLERWS